MKPTPEKILASTIEIIADLFDFGELKVSGDTTIAELQKAGMDSLDQMEFSMELEDQLGVELNEFEPLPSEMTLAQMADKISQMQPS